MTTYRFNFSENINNLLNDFAENHLYDDRHEFKKAWKQYVIEHQSEINNEINKLQQNGYTGEPVITKMFKSTKYYFVKKNKHILSKKKSSKQPYVKVSDEFLKCINSHVLNTPLSKPSEALDDFVQQNQQLIHNETIYLIKQGINVNDICNKIKKTYKNKHYAICHDINTS